MPHVPKHQLLESRQCIISTLVSGDETLGTAVSVNRENQGFGEAVRVACKDRLFWNKAGLFAVTDESLAKDAMGTTEGHNLVEGNVVVEASGGLVR